jgi:hypothetical protein
MVFVFWNSRLLIYHGGERDTLLCSVFCHCCDGLVGEAMTKPTNTDKSRYIAERLVLCWHEPMAEGSQICGKCGNYFDFAEDVSEWNPTFFDPAGRIQLLELMMGRDDYYDFVHDLHWTQQTSTNRGDELLTIPIVYLTTNQDTGLLLDAAYRFLKEKDND